MSPDMKKLRGEIYFLISERPADDLDELVLKDLEKFGMPRDEIVRLVLSKLHSSLTTFYYLLLDISLRKRKKSPPISNTSNSNNNTKIPMEKLGYNNGVLSNNSTNNGNTTSRSTKSAGAVPSRTSPAITQNTPVILNNTNNNNNNGAPNQIQTNNPQMTVNSLRDKINTNVNNYTITNGTAGGEYNYIQQVQLQQSQKQRSSSFNGTMRAPAPNTTSNNIITGNPTAQPPNVNNTNANNNSPAAAVAVAAANNTSAANMMNARLGVGLQRPLSAYAGRR